MSSNENVGCLARILQIFAPGRPMPSQQSDWPYERKMFLLTRAESSFFRVLRDAIGQDFVIFAKVRMGDVIQVRKGTQKSFSWSNRTQQKHFDFVLCDASSLKIAAVIELDDSSHESATAREKDEFKNRALHYAGIPLIRVSSASSYSVRELHDRVLKAVPRVT